MVNDVGKYSQNESTSSNASQAGAMPCNSSFNSAQLLSQRILFTESQVGRSSFKKLLEPIVSQRPGIAPYRIILGNVKEKLLKTRNRLELLLEDLPYEYESMDYYETSEQLFHPLLLFYDSSEFDRHSEALDAITRYLDMATYSERDETRKLEFLTRELKRKRF